MHFRLNWPVNPFYMQSRLLKAGFLFIIPCLYEVIIYEYKL